MKQTGELVDWNDARGFGFIAADDGGRYFVHISAIARIANRPRTGDRVSFIAATGRDGRPQANSVNIAGANPRATPEVLRRGLPEPARKLDWRIPMALLLVALLTLALLDERLPWLVGGVYALMGALSFLNYADDKNSAGSGAWRTQEKRLLGTDLLFGIIGGLLGQALFRHKTRKSRYVAATIAVASIHLLWLGAIAFGLVDLSHLASIAAF